MSYALNLQNQLLGEPNEDAHYSSSIIFELWAKKQKEKTSKTSKQMIRVSFEFNHKRSCFLFLILCISRSAFPIPNFLKNFIFLYYSVYISILQKNVFSRSPLIGPCSQLPAPSSPPTHFISSALCSSAHNSRPIIKHA